jgi:hypothetical protein
MSGKEIAIKRTVDVEKRQAIIARLQTMLDQVPGSDGDGLVIILEQLLAAESPEDLDRPWNTKGMSDYLDRPILITGVKKVPSQFRDNTGFFLVADGVDTATGEEMSFTTSALAVMVQLITCHCNGWLPRIFIPEQATEPTEDGYYPQHLKIYRGPAGGPEPLYKRTERIVQQQQAAASVTEARATRAEQGPAPRPRNDAASVPAQPAF